MQAYWVEFKNGGAGCVEAENVEAAIEIAKTVKGGEVEKCSALPYPAMPRLNEYVHPKHGVCPPFCYTPNECKGRMSCPRNPCCTS